jgi:hypothetical protein
VADRIKRIDIALPQSRLRLDLNQSVPSLITDGPTPCGFTFASIGAIMGGYVRAIRRLVELGLRAKN